MWVWCVWVMWAWSWERVSEWVSGWVGEWVSGWVGGWVSEWGGREEDGRRTERIQNLGSGRRTSLGSAHCPTPATQKRLSHSCHTKAAEPQGMPGCTSDPLAVHIVPRLPRKRGGAPRDARAYIRPLGSAHCPTPATQKRRSPKGRQGVLPTPWQRTLSHACHAKAAELQKNARAYIRPLGRAHCPTPAAQKRRSPKGRQGVHPTPWQCTLSHACHAKAAEPEGTPGRTSDPSAVHIVEPQGTPGRTSDPLAAHIVPRLPRKRGGAPRDARAYIRPLGSAHCPTPATQKRLSPKGRQGVHPTPWQCTLSHACHAKAAEPQGTPGRTSDPLAVHIVPHLPRKSGGAPRDARAYIRPLGSAHSVCPLRARCVGVGVCSLPLLLRSPPLVLAKSFFMSPSLSSHPHFPLHPHLHLICTRNTLPTAGCVRVCVWHVCTDVKLRRWFIIILNKRERERQRERDIYILYIYIYIYILLLQGVTGVPGGSATNEDTSPGPVKTYLRDCGGGPGRI